MQADHINGISNLAWNMFNLQSNAR